ncbi:MAG: hypothetical protein ACTSU5_01150 [Promethearchaeota archaeon]
MSETQKEGKNATLSFTVRIEKSLKETIERVAEEVGVKPSAEARLLLKLAEVVKIAPKSRIMSRDNNEMMLVPRNLFYELLGIAANSLRTKIHYANLLADIVKNQASLQGKQTFRDQLGIVEQLGWFQPIIAEDHLVHTPRDFGPWQGGNPQGDPDFVRAFFYRLFHNQSIPTSQTKDGQDRIDFGKDKRLSSEWSVDSSSPTSHFRIPRVRVEGGD